MRGRALVALTTGAAAAEFAVLQITGPAASGSLAPQVTAPGGLGVLHDLRWIEVFNRSPVSFGLELAGMLAARTLLTAAAVSLAWPQGAPRPGRRRTVLTAAAVTAVAAVVLTPSATLLFEMAVAPLVWWFLAALACGVVPLLLLAQAACPGGWRRPPSAGALAWTAMSGVELTVAALAIDSAGGWLAILPVIAAGVWNACAWRGIAGAAAGRPVRLRAPALGVTAAVIAVAAAFGIGAAAGVGGATGAELPPVHGPVIVVDGFRSRLTRADRGTATIEAFSYRGLDDRGRPLPYAPTATYRSLPSLARLLARQTAVLHARTGRDVTIIATSEGTMVTKLYLLEHPRAPVAEAILLSPIIDASRVQVPARGAASGWGWATRFPAGLTMRLIDATVFHATIDMPLVRSMLANAATLRDDMLCRLPGIPQRAYLPLSSGVATPDAPAAGIPVVVEPVMHGGVEHAGSGLGGGRVRPLQVVRRAAQLQRTDSTTWSFALTLVRRSASAWQVPPLPGDLAHAGRPLPCR